MDEFFMKSITIQIIDDFYPTESKSDRNLLTNDIFCGLFYSMYRISVINPRRLLVLSIVILSLLLTMNRLRGEDEDSSGILRFITETEKCSANIERKENATDEEKKEDKTRKKLGIGETVTVILWGKEELKKPIEDIEWEITGEALLEEKPIKKGIDTIKLKISKTITKKMIETNGGGIEIKVKTKKMNVCPILLNLKLFSRKN